MITPPKSKKFIRRTNFVIKKTKTLMLDAMDANKKEIQLSSTEKKSEHSSESDTDPYPLKSSNVPNEGGQP
jgi:hypothetical protein